MKKSAIAIVVLLVTGSFERVFSQDGSDPGGGNAGNTSVESPATGNSGSAGNAARFGGPNSVEEALAEDRIDVERSGLDRWNAWKDALNDRYGLAFALEYNALGQGYSDSPAGEDWSGGGIVRFFGSWTLVGKDTPNHGSPACGLGWYFELSILRAAKSDAFS